MRRYRLQNRISGSMFTLPICAVVTLLLWIFPIQEGNGGLSVRFSFTPERLAALVLTALVAYTLTETNNVNRLIRVRSRLVSSVWLISAATIPFVHVWCDGLAATACLSVAYYQLFRTYQQRDCQVKTFHYALMIGLGSLFVPHLICFLPFFLWHQTVFLRSTTLRTLCAALLGVILPLVIVAGYALATDEGSFLLLWWGKLSQYNPVSRDAYHVLEAQQWQSWATLSVWGLLGTVHYLCTSYDDRIQTRMLLYILVCQFVSIEVFVGLQPQHLDTWLPMLMLTSAPLIAHFFALTTSWFTNFLFILAFLSFCALGVINLL